jgi:Fe-S-cluster-containing dehydrogenase component
MARRPEPGEDLSQRAPLRADDGAFVVDLRRCIGCHACSVACKTAHDVPLGTFPLRVRWLPRPDGKTYAFVPVFSETECGDDPESLAAGLDPACVRACPTDALVYGERESDAISSLRSRHETKPLTGPEATDLKRNVTYIGLAGFEGGELHRGAALDPRDPDPIYEQS